MNRWMRVLILAGFGGLGTGPATWDIADTTSGASDAFSIPINLRQ